MKKLIVLVLLSIFCDIIYSQQNDIESWEQRNRAEREAFLKRANEEYSNFRDRVNAEYAEFVRRTGWEFNRSFSEIPVPKLPDPPKPVFIPEEEKDRIPENNCIPYEVVIPAPVFLEQPNPIAPVPEIPVLEKIPFHFKLFGTECKVRLTDEHRFTLRNCNENSIADAWQKLSQPQYNNVIRDCLEMRTNLNLSDWAYLHMLQQLSSDFLGCGSNEAALLSAFLFCQSGYKMRLARSNSNRLYFMVASRHGIYSMRYYTIDGEKYYPLNCNEDELYICNISFPNELPLCLTIGKEQCFAMKRTEARTLSSKRYPHVTTNVEVNQNLIDFYNTYPQSFINDDGYSKWIFYANAPISQLVKETLYPVLKNAISGKSEQEAGNILINFVQTAFEYGYDDEIWGEDRPFFPDETIFYPFSDCEDRAILFSRLIRDLMGLKVVLIYYPGHLATAVQFNENIPGDYLTANGKRFLVCDPTYIGARIGKTMPNMDNSNVKVILLD